MMISELEMTRPSQTLGEYRVGITFNPGGNPMVDKIKRAAADLIDLVNAMGMATADTDPGEFARLKAIAMTHFEEGAMSAVKAATKPPRDA